MLTLLSQRCLLLFTILCLSACSTATKTPDEEKKIATAKINTQLGIAYLEQHNVGRAKRKLLMALDDAPTIPDTWYAMGYFLEATGDKTLAEKYYLKAVSLAPTRGDVQNNYGTFLCRSGKYQESIEHFRLAINDIRYVDSAGAYENAGLCALKIPDKKLALVFFNKSIQQDPERPSANLALAELQYQIGNYQASKQSLMAFLKLSPHNAESYKLSDQLHTKLGGAFFVGET